MVYGAHRVFATNGYRGNSGQFFEDETKNCPDWEANPGQ